MNKLSSYLVLIALAVAGMIPRGWMPTHGEDGKILMVICTGEGVVEQWVDLGIDADEDAPAHSDTHEGDRGCPFAALTHVADLLGETALPMDLAPKRSPWAHELFTHASAGFHWRYDARGPPTLS